MNPRVSILTWIVILFTIVSLAWLSQLTLDDPAKPIWKILFKKK